MEEKKSPVVPILIVIIVLLLAIIGYLLMNNSSKTDIIVQQTEQIEADSINLVTKVEELEELNLALNRAKMEMDEMGRNNDTLNQQIGQLENYINDVKAQLRKQKSISAAQMKELNAKLSEYKKLLEMKDNEIVSLRAQNDSLNTKVGVMNDSINNLQTEKTELAKQVAIASILKARSINVFAITKKDKQLDKDEYRAKDIYKLKITFNFDDNKVASKSNKNVMMRLIEPSGSVLFDAALGGGYFTTAEGKEMPYTDKRSILFDNTNQQVKFIYLKGSDYRSGNYKVEIYADGYKIGETSFVVK